MMRFDTIVVGKGLIGSAAARHLTLMGRKVALVGPDEPGDKAGHDGVFGAHYDEGRITRILDPDPVQALMAERSIARYRELEADSGIAFFNPCGAALVCTPGDPALEKAEAVGRRLGVLFERLEGEALEERLPWLRPDPHSVALLQDRRAGTVNPRALVEAQSLSATRRGADIIAETVVRLQLAQGGVLLVTESGRELAATRVLLATGAFTGAHPLLPWSLDLRRGGRVVLFAEVDPNDNAGLADMPSLIVSRAAPEGIAGVYLLPPLPYPDQTVRVKIGGARFGQPLDSAADAQRWCRTDGSDLAPALEGTLHDLIPALKGAPTTTETCVITETRTGHPYIDWIVPDRLAVAVGGNGWAAKSSDELGRLAAALVDGRADFAGHPPDLFRALPR